VCYSCAAPAIPSEVLAMKWPRRADARLDSETGGSAEPESSEAQKRVEERVSELVLYHFESCPYCARVRDVIEKLELEIELRDIRASRAYHDELARGGGRATVPCLRIADAGEDVRWLYESSEIIAYLTRRFAT
jgi:glutaredoxin